MTTSSPFRSRRRGTLLLLALVALPAVTAGCLGTGSEDTAIRRGDVAFATDSLDEALAEYLLAVSQGDESGPTLARVGHTYAALERVDEAAEYYRRAAALDSAWADQAAADLMGLARRAQESGDRFLMATSVQEALTLRPGLGLGDMALPLARHYFRNGEFGRALPLFQQVLAHADSVPEVLYEIGQAHENIGDCRQALVYFERYRETVERSVRERDQVDWYIGSCAFQLARELEAERDPPRQQLEEALAMVDRVIDVAQPRHLLGQAWFEKGEILAALGECEAAMDAFSQVRFVEPTGGGALVNRAQRRYDEIRFGRGLSRFREEGGCG